MTENTLGTTTSAQIATIAPELTVINGQVTTTSLQIAEHFGKRHADVLRAIKNLIKDLSDERKRNFAPMVVTVEIGSGASRQDPAYRLTRDGFTLIAMSFTGKEALQWKLAYLDTFNRMEAALTSQVAIPATITPAQAQHLKELVQIVVESGKQSYGETYARLQRKFHVNSYLALTPAQFEPACAYLSGKVDGPGMAAIVQKHFPQITLTKEPDMAEPTRTLDAQAVSNAIDAATAIGAQVQKAVVHAMLSGSTSFRNGRWMVSFAPDARYGVVAVVDTVGQDDVVASLPVLASMIAEPGGFMPTTEELAALGSACMSRLSQRLPMRKAA